MFPILISMILLNQMKCLGEVSVSLFEAKAFSSSTQKPVFHCRHMMY